MPDNDRRQEDISVLDQALELYSSASVLTLLRAALESPGCARFHEHLLLIFARSLAAPARDGRAATVRDLPVLLHAALQAARRGITTHRFPNSPADAVRFTLKGRRYLVHPGDLDHPLPVLRSLRDTADAVDDHLIQVRGFGIDDVLELALRHTDHTVACLAAAWPPADEAEPMRGQITCEVSGAEITAAAGLGIDHLTTAAADDPERTTAALAYLTRNLNELPLLYDPGLPLLGPTLLISDGERTVPVPASTALEAVTAAAADLLDAHPAPPEALMRLRRRAATRVAGLLGLDHAPAEPEEVCRISSLSHRLEIAIVATLGDDLAVLVEKARTELSSAPAGTGRLVIYAGPRFLGREVITDTLYVHVEELTEIFSAAGGDLTKVALWVLELTEHPGCDAVAYYDVLDAWTAWSMKATLLPPGPAGEGGVVVEPCGWDVSWERAALWARTDDLLAATGLPPAIDWADCRLAAASEGDGQWADLRQRLNEGIVKACISTHPPLVIVATLDCDERALLDEASLAGLADGIRGTLAADASLTQHSTLPDRRPVLLHLTETLQPHRPAADLAPEVPDDALALQIGLDEEAARIDLVLDPLFLARFTEDGHRVLGLVLNHTIGRLRTAHGAKNGLNQADFSNAWDAAVPILTWYAGDPYAPPPAPHHYLPSSTPHVRVRALRVAADAVRAAGLPAGTFTGREAVGREGHASQLLTALEDGLTGQLRAHRPDLVPALVRHLNAALATRTEGRRESLTGLVHAGGKPWQEEAERRESDGAAITTALQLLIQQALITPPAGDKPTDLIALAELTALAELLLRTALVAIPASRGLHPATLTVHPSGVFTLDGATTTSGADSPEHLGLDIAAYRNAQEQAWFARARQSHPQPLAPEELFTARRGGRTPIAFTRLNPPPGSTLTQADRDLTACWGCGLDGLAAVLATAADWPTRPDGTAFTSRQDLAREAAAWSQLPETQTRAAVDQLVLDPANAAGSLDHAYAEVERRIRPTTHPLIAHDDGIIIAPWLVHTSQQLYAAGLADGRLPRPDAPAKVTGLLERHRQQQNNQLETDLAQAAARAGLPHLSRLDRGPAAAADIPGLPGEVDLLVADPRGRLWVIEAKNPQRAVGIHKVAQNLGRFTGYRKKLLAKAEVIRAHAAAAARACGVQTARDWTVTPLFVTRNIDPAAFTTDPQIAFTTIDHLAALLADGTEPKAGWNQSPARP
ncbi:hypothetical protein [Streptomyces sp. MBT33]|uniref:hypothetical protein n=1 Tax=Streptomyces sp. MBT33 TaxID=1488363 RepID=UPI00190DC303|nr:hypothetical protein [Streptomyces sp. MBT33]MBK3647268.1 hypothetical protein [Streptomyces sp. MBT33]